MELKKQETTELAKPFEDDLGAGDELGAEDIGIGRLLIGQALSERVKERECSMGDIYNSLTGEICHELGKDKLELIIISARRYWVHKENDEFRGITPNAKGPNDFEWENGNKKNIFVHSFYGILANDLKLGFPMPVELGFSSTNLKTAKKLSAYLLKMRKNPKGPQASWNRCFNLSTVERKKDRHSWYGFEIEPGRETTSEEIRAAFEWRQVLKSQEITVRPEDFAEEGMTARSSSREFAPDDTEF